MIGPVALATCAEVPVESNEAPLEVALDAAGVACRWEVWDDPAVDWSTYAAVLIRTTWDYTDKIEAFRQWVRSVDAVTTLWNPAAVVAWNSHKRYLVELGDRGVAVTPTELVPVGTSPARALLQEAGSVGGPNGFVVKPAESVGGIGLTVWSPDDRGRDGALDAVGELHREGRDALVQPLLPAIHDEGEISLIFVDGALSHTVAKRPRAGTVLSHPEHGARLDQVDTTPEQHALGLAAIASALAIVGVDEVPMHARVDCVEHEGAPVVMELELIEPDLYLGFDTAAAARVAAAVVRRLGS